MLDARAKPAPEAGARPLDERAKPAPEAGARPPANRLAPNADGNHFRPKMAARHPPAPQKRTPAPPLKALNNF